MDPNATWTKIVESADAVGEASGTAEIVGAAADLADAVRDLHEWLQKGGFPPNAMVSDDERYRVVRFTPDAVRSHFEGNADEELEGLTDDDLRAGADVLLNGGGGGFWEMLEPWWYDILAYARDRGAQP